jgi:hypothetical protein
MKNVSKILFLFIGPIILFSCGGNKETDEKIEAKEVANEEICIYSYDNSTTIVQWTAYKFSEKSPVQGKFDSVTVSGTSDNEDASAVINGATFEIKTSSVQTNDAEKNGNIVAGFFNAMVNTSTITGTIKSISSEKAVIGIKMNDVEFDVKGNVSFAENKLSFKADVSLNNWNGQTALNSLNNRCKKNHTGTDGKLVAWPDVSIYVETTLKQACK